MPQIISFIGYHNSGKTTVIRKVAKELISRGLKIGVIKSTKHHLCSMHKEGSDTWLYKKDGISDISIVCPDGVVHFKSKDEFDLFYAAFSMFSQVDVILCEGFKNESSIKKIEVAREEISKELLKDKVGGVIAVVSDFDIDNIKHFSFKEIKELCNFIIEHFNISNKPFFIDLFVNKRRIPLKRFVKDSLKNTVCGYVSALKFTENAEEIELKIKLKKPDKNNLDV